MSANRVGHQPASGTRTAHLGGVDTPPLAPPSQPRPVRRVLRPLFLVTLLFLGACGAPAALASFRYLREPEALTVPVAGVSRAHLRSTFGAPRPGGRKHRGTDIFAPRGTPVVAAADGIVWKVGSNPLGGRVVWVFGEGAALYYYAHLDGWAPGLDEGQRVSRGALLGFVGTTGNAATTPPHLHFGIYPLRFPRFGVIDPVPPLQRTADPFRS